MIKSDAQVRSEVEAELRAEPELDAGHIRVRVEAGCVWLSGSVSSLHELVTAGKAVWRVCGVEAVGNGLRIDWPAQHGASHP